jgi:hypothetical protein
MRIKIIRNPTVSCIDGVQLDHFRLGFKYDVGSVIATYLITEGWAEPILDDSPALITTFDELHFDRNHDPHAPPNLTREFFPPYYDAPPSLALDRRRLRRRSP